MQKRGTLILILVLLFSACGKRDQQKTSSTPPPSKSPPVAVTPTPPLKPPSHRFVIRDIDQRETSIEFLGDRTLFHKIRQPIVMITLFSDWCPPCRGMLPYLNRLQAENSEDLFLIGILVHSDLNDEGLRRFMQRYESSFFISNHSDNDALGTYLARRYELGENYPLPLTLIFKNGKYLMNISGATPYEMLQSLLNQLKDKKRKKD